MIFNFRISRLVLALLFVLGITFSTKAQDKLWEKDLTDVLSKVNWVEQSNDGIIIASGDKGILGLDNNTGEVLWHNKELKAVDKSTFYVVEGLPIIHVQYQSLTGKKRSLLLNSASGNILFDTKEEEMTIGKSNLLPQISSILFEMKQGKNNKLLLFNYMDSKVEWVIDMGESAGVIKAIKNAAFGIQGFLDKAPKLIEKSHLLITEKQKITVIDIKTGEKTWNQEFSKKVKAALYSTIDKKVYVGEKNKLRIFEAVSGTDVSNKKIKLTGELQTIFIDSKQNIVIVDFGGFNLLDPKAEEFVWKKSVVITGLYNVIELDDHYYAIGAGEKSSTAMKVTREGKKVWKENIAGAIYYIQPIESGLFYLSSERSNILSFEDGEDVWKKDVKFKTIPAVGVDDANNEVVFYSKKSLYKFNLKTGKLDLLNKEIKFEKANNAIFYLEVRPEGYFVHADQHVSFFDRKGINKYMNYYKPFSKIATYGLVEAAEIGAFVATGIDIDVSGSMKSIQDLKNLSKGTMANGGDQTEGRMEEKGIAAVQFIAVSKKRYFNSKNVKDAKFIVTETENNGQILRVNKDNGEITHKIDLVDKTPSYVVDEIDSRVFVSEKNKTITCYQVK